jgi:MerR family transcriptional activator of bmr gene
MKQFLSIGEVAKARNVNVQSLRYYEKLGILIPAYTNPQNGYRYYTLEQIMILDTILLCIDLGIPLKELINYVDDNGQLQFERLLEDGQRLAKEKIQKIQENLHSIDHTLQHVHAQKAFLGQTGYYTRPIVSRYVITVPCEQIPEPKTYEKCLSSLFDLGHKKDLRVSFTHGILSNYHDGHYVDSHMFLEVLPKRSTQIENFPAGNYLCFQEKREIHSDPGEIFAAQLGKNGNAQIIVSSMSPSSYKYDEVILEFQLLEKHCEQ